MKRIVISLFSIVVLLTMALPVMPVAADDSGTTNCTEFSAPNQTVASSSVGDPDNGWASDDHRATFNNPNDTAEYGFPDLGIPPGATIDGIEVTIEGYHTNNKNLTVALWNASNGNAYTSNTQTTAFPSASDTTQTLGGTTSKWGKTWTVADFADATFRIRVESTGGSGDALLDQVQVKVCYTITGPTNPTVTINQASGQADSTSTSPIDFDNFQ